MAQVQFSIDGGGHRCTLFKVVTSRMCCGVDANETQILLNVYRKDGKYGKCVFGNAEAIITDCIWAVADQNNNQSIYYIKDDRNPYNTGTSMISAFNGLYKDIEWGYGFDLYFENDVLYLMYKRRDEGGLGKLSMQVKIKMI